MIHAEEIRKLAHDLQNSAAAMQLWLGLLLDQSCEECIELREQIGAGIRRNIKAVLAASRRLTELRRSAEADAPPRIGEPPMR